ncbi:MAG: MBL fold metallo-hydrolase [Clostridia bacterium]|nr:MBL fold metallo-hydrolase [Clostridia bacterium]
MISEPAGRKTDAPLFPFLLTSLYSGSSGNAWLVRCGPRSFLVDAGKSARTLTRALAFCGVEPEDLDAVFVTHDHGDHISALPVFSARVPCPIYATEETASTLTACGVFRDRIGILPAGGSARVGEVTVRSFPTPHDAPGSVCYRFETDEDACAVATDVGRVTDEVFACLCGCRTVGVEANHDEERLRSGPYPYPLKRRILSDEGHLSNAACAALLRRLAENGAEEVILAHLSRENNTPALALAAAREALSGFPHVSVRAAAPAAVVEAEVLCRR